MRALRRAGALAKFFYAQRISGLSPPTEPHFDEVTAGWFAREIGRAAFYLEFGSGGSTILASKTGVRTISVEGDRFYAKVVRAALKSGSVQMITPDLGITKEWSFPLIPTASKGLRYVQAPFALMGSDFPDLVLVDGRYRVASALETARRARLHGTLTKLLLDDYDDRPQYHVVEDYLGPPTAIGRAALFVVGEREIPSELVERYASDPA